MDLISLPSRKDFVQQKRDADQIAALPQQIT
jgi:hypothetical protein